MSHRLGTATCRRMFGCAVLLLAVVSGCAHSPPSAQPSNPPGTETGMEPGMEMPPESISPDVPSTNGPVSGPSPVGDPLPGMPPVPDPRNVYADAGPNMLNDVTRKAKPLVYVPHTRSGDVWVIDPKTFAVVGKYPAGVEVQHVVPAWDMKTLYATDDRGDTVMPFNPETGLPGPRIPVIDPYNMYFSPDGKAAIVVAEARRKLIWYDPRTWKIDKELSVPECAGIDHADFTPNGRIAVFSCEFDGRVAVVDVAGRSLLRLIDMPHRNHHMGPQDVKLAPDGSVFYVADSDQNGVWVIDGAATKVLREIPTGLGAHGLYLDREGKRLFVTNRREGSISVLDPFTGKQLTKWHVPGATFDMGGLTADGKQLWLSGRYDNHVWVIDTDTGHLIKEIPVGSGPHGLCVWPQTGRYSLGHTGITR